MINLRFRLTVRQFIHDWMIGQGSVATVENILGCRIAQHILVQEGVGLPHCSQLDQWATDLRSEFRVTRSE